MSGPSNELFSEDGQANRTDAHLHEYLLANPSAEIAADLAAIESGVGAGMSRDQAIGFYASALTKAYLEEQAQE
jgi:hypothetical protein